ncbi:hypothetical protein [Streptomyces sp. ISL-99]|uniref:hypothetical protein n=1 Tax=Streptomyces sp. ISL-99 TaxID=2819193 RepID=UPI002036345E|nr:hypothetical protein [Streptomyces sp. ISL-99]
MVLSRQGRHSRYGRHPRTAAWAAAAMLILVPAAAACGDDNDAPEAPPRSPAVGTSPPAIPERDAPADPAAARAAVEKSWKTFFDPKASVETKAKVLQNGERMRSLLTAFADDPNAKRSSVDVKDVKFTSATEADVTYDLLVGGQPALPDSKGTSVLQGDVWKVSVKTLCALVQVSGNAPVPPGC